MVAFSRRLLKTRIILETKADRQSLLVETVYQWSGRGGGGLAGKFTLIRRYRGIYYQ